jgi:hypothetical protein
VVAGAVVATAAAAVVVDDESPAGKNALRLSVSSFQLSVQGAGTAVFFELANWSLVTFSP